MNISFNSNIKLLTGGSFSGGSNWNKTTNDTDNCYKIYLFKNGDAQLDGKDKSEILSAGQLYFINGYAIQAQSCKNTMSVEWIHFLPESVYFNHVLKHCTFVHKLKLEEFHSFRAVFENLCSFFNGSLPIPSEKILQLKIQSLIQYVIASVFSVLDTNVFENSDIFLRLYPSLQFITAHYRENISLNQVAERCNLSPNYFHRLFTDTFQISPFNYIRQLKMEESVRQLIYTHKAIKNIAFDIGYEDEAYFSRTFSKIYATSPGKFRAINRKKLP